MPPASLRQKLLGLMAGLGLIIPGTALAGVFNPETFTLENGMRVVVIPNHRAPVVTHNVYYRSGAADERPGKSGIAHFLEHLMFKGTPDVASGEFSKIVARNGGRDNAFTSWDYTGYFQNVAKDRLQLVMQLEADRMVNLVLSEQDVATEREVILEERRSRIDNNPGALLREQMSAALFMNHPYGRPIIGWEVEIRQLSREDALDWYRTYYAPNDAILVVAGDITAAELRPMAERTYGVIPPRDLPERQRPAEPTQHAPRRVIMESPRVQQPNWSRRYLAPSFNRGETQHAYPLDVLGEILSGGATGRLYRQLVVEQGLAASAQAYYDPSNLDYSNFGFFLSPRPGKDARENLAALEDALEKIIAELVENGVTEEELERAKSRMQANAIYARDSLQAGARVIGSALTSGQTVDDVEAWPDRIAAVTLEQVNAAIRAVFDIRRSVTGLLLPEPTS